MLVVLAAAAAGGVAAASTANGTFALQGGAVKTSGYLDDRPAGRDALLRTLDIWLTAPGSASPLRSYDVDMTKRLHLIIVSDDLRFFAHVHPVLQPSGHFLIRQRFPARTLYHVYADATPHGIGQQVFRFDVALGKPSGARDLGERQPKATTGPYTVSLSSLALNAGRPTRITVHIRRGNAPAADLHPYLGELAHAVFIDTSDFSYVHVHPMPANQPQMKMDMSSSGMAGMEMPSLPEGAKASPDMALQVAVGEPGTYKLWLQFRGGSQLYVAPFVLSAR